jgi:predicted transcriptional regulator of viral defense system
MTYHKRVTSRERVTRPEVRRLDERFALMRSELQRTGTPTVTAAIARRYGISSAMLAYRARIGELARVDRGQYRYPDDVPRSYAEHVRAYAERLGVDAIASHQTALQLHELSDVNPPFVEFTLPRGKRSARRRPPYRFHTAAQPLPVEDVMDVAGVRTTSPARTIVDAARSGVGYEQLELAITQALERGLATPEDFCRNLTLASGRVRDVLTPMLREATIARKESFRSR